MLKDKIRYYRLAKRLTQKDLAAKAGTTQQRVALFEKGAAVPSTETLVKIANALEVTVYDLDESLCVNLSEKDLSALDRIQEENDALTIGYEIINSLNQRGINVLHDICQVLANTPGFRKTD